ncbi:MAG: response regulator [Candidatus Omnitrophota bacterium]
MAKKRILVIDDEKGFTELVEEVLLDAGKYEVRIVNSAHHAVAAAKEFFPQLILLDLMMPEMDGADVAEKIKKDESIKDIPIVFLTAMVTSEETEIGTIGGHKFLAKPVGIRELMSCVEQNIR